jgi:hypothetical protein
MTFPCQLGLQYNPPAPFGAGPPSVQGILSLYKLGLEIRLDLKEAEGFASIQVEVAASVYTLEVMKTEGSGYSVTAYSDGHCKQSFFPLRERGTSWDTLPQ